MEGSKLYVGNINYNTTSDQLKELFSGYGTVSEATVIAGKGFGFVTMSSSEEANKAKEALNGSTLDGRTIKVDLARPMKQGGRGFGGGGFGGGGFNRGGGFKRSGFRGDR